MISLFTFILVLGIVVDDAIIVGENIFIFKQRGLGKAEAAFKGAHQVATPVIFAVLTTMVTFSPMILVEGALGKIWRIIPVVTIVVLIMSLIESLTILPAHLAHMSEKRSKNIYILFFSSRWEKMQNQVNKYLQNFIRSVYEPTLQWV